MNRIPSDELPLTDRLEAMAPQDLRAWLAALLRGEISGIPGAVRAGYLPHALIVEVFPSLSPGVRQGITDAISGWVREMVGSTQSCWRSEAGDELLLLTQAVCGPKLIDEYLRLAGDETLLVPDGPKPALDLHHRALQSLVAARWRGYGDWQAAVDFWHREARLTPRYAGTAFEGLAQVKPALAIELIAILPWNGEVPANIIRRLTWLLDQWSPAAILPIVQELLPKLVEPAREAIAALMEREGLSLELPVANPRRAATVRDFFARHHIPVEVCAGAGI